MNPIVVITKLLFAVGLVGLIIGGILAILKLASILACSWLWILLLMVGLPILFFVIAILLILFD